MTLRRVPWFSIVSLSVIATFQVVTQVHPSAHETLRSLFALDYGDLTHLRLQRLLVSPLIQTRPGFVGTVIWFAMALLPMLEMTVGGVATAATFFLGDWVSTVWTLGMLRAGAALGSSAAAHLLTQPDSGSSSGTFACAGALLVLGPRWLRIAGLGGLTLFFVWRMVLFHRLFDVQHLLATATGVALALVFVHSPRVAKRLHRPAAASG